MPDKIFEFICENGKKQISSNIDDLIKNLDLNTFNNINDKLASLSKENEDLKKLYNDINANINNQLPDYDIALADIKDNNEKYWSEIDKLNKTFIKESYFITNPGNIKKTIGYNDSSVRIGHNKIQDWDGSPESKYKNLKGNIGMGMKLVV